MKKKKRPDDDWEILGPMMSYFILLGLAVAALILGMKTYPIAL